MSFTITHYDSIAFIKSSSRLDSSAVSCTHLTDKHIFSTGFITSGLCFIVPCYMSTSSLISSLTTLLIAEYSCITPYGFYSAAFYLLLAAHSNTSISEVSQLYFGGIIRAVSLSSNSGVKLYSSAFHLARSICVPLGTNMLGRVFNVLGSTLDGHLNITMLSGFMLFNSTIAQYIPHLA